MEYQRLILQTLQDGWASIPARFQRLTPEQQNEFLQQQGYARLADLLAHVIAWWEAGCRDIEIMLHDPNFKSPEVDVDAFNAQAVRRFQDWEEPEVIETFETQRKILEDYVACLPEEAFENQAIVDRLNMEIVGHLKGHAIP